MLRLLRQSQDKVTGYNELHTTSAALGRIALKVHLISEQMQQALQLELKPCDIPASLPAALFDLPLSALEDAASTSLPSSPTVR